MLRPSPSGLHRPGPRRGEGGCALFVVILIVGAIILWCNNTPEGKRAVQQAIAAAQPPVHVSLSPFLVFNGYYVNVTNTSRDRTLTGVAVTYTGADGIWVRQSLGTLRPGETRTLDPSDVGWMVERHETITVSADQFPMSKVLDTNGLLDR